MEDPPSLFDEGAFYERKHALSASETASYKLMSRSALLSRHSREDGNPSDLARSGLFPATIELASMDSRLHGNDRHLLVHPA
jgi:hypothetical protein